MLSEWYRVLRVHFRPQNDPGVQPLAGGCAFLSVFRLRSAHFTCGFYAAGPQTVPIRLHALCMQGHVLRTKHAFSCRFGVSTSLFRVFWKMNLHALSMQCMLCACTCMQCMHMHAQSIHFLVGWAWVLDASFPCLPTLHIPGSEFNVTYIHERNAA